MSGGPGNSSPGAVLRGLELASEPVVLRTPRSARAGAGSHEREATTQADPGLPSTPGYEDGLRDGMARAEAAIRARDLELVEERRRAGFEEGRGEGRRQGIAEGRELGKAEIEGEMRAATDAAKARVGQLDGLLASFRLELARRLDEAQEDMVALCHAVVCRILGEQLCTPEGVAQAVRCAIGESVGNGGAQLSVHVHPRDLATLEGDANLAAWLEHHATSGAVRWVADERVRMGGCLVQSAEGSLDARLETQLNALRAHLMGARPRGSSRDDMGTSGMDAVAGGGA